VATLLALLSSALWGTSDFTGGTLSRRISALTVAVVSEAIGLVGVLVAAVITGAFTASTGYVGWGLLGAVAGSAGIIAFYRALATGTMGVIAPIAATGVIVPVLFGVGQGDRPSPLQDAGILVAIIGVILASGPEIQRGGGRAAAKPLWLAGLAAFGFGIVFVSLAHGARSSTLMTLVVMRSAAVVMMLVIAWTTSSSQLRFAATDLPLLTVVGAFDVGANLTFSYASRHGLLSVVSVLSSLYPAVTVVLARTVHHERLRRVQLLGVVAAMGGVVLIAS
jgi:drug/metabolite transporter (DMT)-like permease